jgi:hypothetical protein
VSGLEGGVGRLRGDVLLEDTHEAPLVRLLPVPPRAFALLHGLRAPIPGDSYRPSTYHDW